MFRKLLVANRGEIAVRVIRACKEMGIASVAVHSDADAQALHVKMADEAVRVGPAPSRQSYLVQERVLEAAADTGAEAIHPGYGFLSENAGFARAVQKAGLTWVGPDPAAMDAMGDKVSARRHAEEAGVPLAPGSGVLRDVDHAVDEARRIGYPVMMKASAGGGGIGMRVLRDDKEVQAAFDAASDQARSAFGVPDLFLERFVERPRHIEVQVLGDKHGRVVHLFERECSIQRRHQKLVEEAPSPALSQEERESIGARSVALAKRVGYDNAGTMEFLFERGPDGGPLFHFNEMNTRLQVEHPVTELVTGIDLVQCQIRVAAGEPLGFGQDDVRLRGHAFEARINAEDPRQGFAPSPGPVDRLRLPQGPGVRIDGALYEGWTVPGEYDSMVLKLLTWAPDRELDRRRMLRALGELDVQGFVTNASWHSRLFEHAAFAAGDLSTRFLEEHDLLSHGLSQSEAVRVVAAALALHRAPGGGLAGIHLAQERPAVVATGASRDWRPA